MRIFFFFFMFVFFSIEIFFKFRSMEAISAVNVARVNDSHIFATRVEKIKANSKV